MPIEYPMVVRVDNIGAMFLANNSVLSQQTKQISVKHHFIREVVYIDDIFWHVGKIENCIFNSTC